MILIITGKCGVNLWKRLDNYLSQCTCIGNISLVNVIWKIVECGFIKFLSMICMYLKLSSAVRHHDFSSLILEMFIKSHASLHNSLTDGYMRQTTKPSLVQIMAWHWQAPSHYLNQCCHINWTLRNKFEWNCNQDTTIFMQKKSI